MPQLALRIIKEGDKIRSFFRHYYADNGVHAIDFNQMRGSAPFEALIAAFPNGSCIGLHFETNKIFIQADDILECSLDGQKMKPWKSYLVPTQLRRLTIGKINLLIEAFIC